MEKLAEEQVWDIEVEGTHNFVGNDIIAHNTYITGNATTTALRVTTLNVAGDDVSDITGAGLTISNGALTVQGSAVSGINGAWEYNSAYDAIAPTSSKGILVTASSTIAANFRIDRTAGGAETLFRVGSSTADVLVVKSDGNVGIGTASPAYKLDVGGNINLTAGSQVEFNGGSSSKIQGGGTSPNNYLAFYVGNTIAQYIDTNGSVGIGLTSPTSTLTVLQNPNGATPALTIEAESAATANLLQLTNSSGAFLSGFTADGGLLLNTASTTAIRVQNGSGVDEFVINAVTGNATSTGHFAALGGNSDQWNLAYASIWGTASEQSFWNTTSTWAGFQGEFDAKLNATSTLDLTTLEVTNLAVGGQTFTDLTGAGLTLSGSALAIDPTVVGLAGASGAWQALAGNILTPTSTGAGILVNAASSTITNLVVSDFFSAPKGIFINSASTTALNIQNGSGASVFVVNSTNKIAGIATTTPVATFAIATTSDATTGAAQGLYIDTRTTAGFSPTIPANYIFASTTQAALKIQVPASSSNYGSLLVLQSGISSGNNLLQLQNSSGTFLSGFTAAGGLLMNISSTTALNIQTGSGSAAFTINTGTGANSNSTTTAVGYFNVNDTSANNVFQVDTTQSSSAGIDITAAGSQTANLLNFYSSGEAFLSGFTVAGGLLMNISSTTAINIQNGSGVKKFWIDSATGNATTTGNLTFNQANPFIQFAPAAAGDKLSFQSGTTTLASLDLGGAWSTKGPQTANTTPDYAETVLAAPDVEAGDVVAIDPGQPQRVIKSQKAYASGLAGVISTNPGFLIRSLNNALDEPTVGMPLALAGRVPVKVTDENGAILAGEPLTSSARFPGYAMRATRSGNIIGYAFADFIPATASTSSYLLAADNETHLGKIMHLIKVGWEAIGSSGSIVIDTGDGQTATSSDPSLVLQSSSRGSQAIVGASTAALLVNQLTPPNPLFDKEGGRAGGEGSIANLLQLQADGIDKLLVTTNGATRISGNLNCGIPSQSPLNVRGEEGGICPDLFVVSNNGSELFGISATGTVTVAYDLIVSGEATFERHIHAGADVAGQVILAAGDTATTTLYNVAYGDTPIINLTPNSRVGSEYWVENISARDLDPATTSADYVGFKVNIAAPADHPVVFNYIIVGADEKLAALEVLEASRVVSEAPLNVTEGFSLPDGGLKASATGGDTTNPPPLEAEPPTGQAVPVSTPTDSVGAETTSATYLSQPSAAPEPALPPEPAPADAGTAPAAETLPVSDAGTTALP